MSSMTFLPDILPSLIALRTPLAPASRVRPASPSPAIWSCFVSSGSASMSALHARVMAARNSVESAAVTPQHWITRLSKDGVRLTGQVNLLALVSDRLLDLGAELAGLLARGPAPAGGAGRGVEQAEDVLGRVGVALAREEQESEGETRHVKRGHVRPGEDAADGDVLLLQPRHGCESQRWSALGDKREGNR